MKRIFLSMMICTAAAIALTITRTDASATVVALPLPDGCVWCHGDCETGMHNAGDGGMSLPEEWTRNGGAHLDGSCFSGTCSTKHGPSPCDEGGGTVIPEGASASLLKSLRTRDANSFRQLAAAYPNNVRINGDRSAIQILGCKQSIVAHFPIDRSFFMQLAG